MSDGFTDAKTIINNNCQITIPETMLKKLGFEKGDVLRLTATESLIVIEKCEDEEDEY
jgi:bifunctional DNA-binding transcriptional regulator/antitoxin component of YhaV-PrlF toxin-antitoxin module